MAPTNECFQAYGLARGQIDQGLIVDIKLLKPQRIAKHRLDCHPVFQPLIHVLTEDLYIVPAPILSLIHGGVGVLKELDHVSAVARKKADANTCGSLQRTVIDNDGRIQDLNDSPCSEGHFLIRPEIEKQYHKLIASHAHDDIGVAHALPQAVRHDLQQLITSLVAIRVIDMFEAIQIEKHDA